MTAAALHLSATLLIAVWLYRLSYRIDAESEGRSDVTRWLAQGAGKHNRWLLDHDDWYRRLEGRVDALTARLDDHGLTLYGGTDPEAIVCGQRVGQGLVDTLYVVRRQIDSHSEAIHGSPREGPGMAAELANLRARVADLTRLQTQTAESRYQAGKALEGIASAVKEAGELLDTVAHHTLPGPAALRKADDQ